MHRSCADFAEPVTARTPRTYGRAVLVLHPPVPGPIERAFRLRGLAVRARVCTAGWTSPRAAGRAGRARRARARWRGRAPAGVTLAARDRRVTLLPVCDRGRAPRARRSRRATRSARGAGRSRCTSACAAPATRSATRIPAPLLRGAPPGARPSVGARGPGAARGPRRRRRAQAALRARCRPRAPAPPAPRRCRPRTRWRWRPGRRGAARRRASSSAGSAAARLRLAADAGGGAAILARDRASRRCRSLRRAHGLLRHDADLLRQRGAAPRATRTRRSAPTSSPATAPARGGGLLPHGHRRARGAGRAGGRARGRDAEGARRPQRRALPGPDADPRTSPTTSSSARRDERHKARGPGDHAARPRQRARLQGPVRGLVLPPLRGLQDGGRDRARQHLPDPPDPARRASTRRTGSSGCRRSRSSSSSCTPTGRTSCCRASATTRRASFITGGLQDVSLSRAQADLGRRGPVGHRPRLLRLVRRAAQLLHGAALRRARART